MRSGLGKKQTKKSIDKWDSLLFGLLNKFHFRLKSFGFLSPRLMDVNFHQISIFCYFFASDDRVSQTSTIQKRILRLVFFFIWSKNKFGRWKKNPLTLGRCDHPSWFLSFYFFLRPSPLMPFCYSKVVVFFPPFITELFILFLYGVYNIQQQQPTHKHLKDTPTRWPYALLCGYLYQNGPCPAPLQYIEPNNTVCVICVRGDLISFKNI